MVGVIFFVAAVIGALHTALALFGFRRPAMLYSAAFFSAWLAGDLAYFHIAWQAVAVVIFLALGALDNAWGEAALLLTLVSWVGLFVAHRRQYAAERVLEAALVEALGSGYQDEIRPELAQNLRHTVPLRELMRPFRPRIPGVEVIRNVGYGDHKRHTLGIVRPAEPVEKAPVLLQIHGGGWVIGQYQQQGQPLMHHLASQGWVCVAPNYRLSPRVRFPEHLIDCKRALAWIREHVAEYGGDPDYVVVTGGSAGGHLSALMALTANDSRYQPGFEEVDTTLRAAVPMYGVFDLTDRNKVRGNAAMTPFLERMVMPTKLEDDPQGWNDASPIGCVCVDAPPFFVIHGAFDSLVWVEDARHFSAELRSVSREPVAYAEVPYAQHGFDVMTTARTVQTVNAIARFLAWVRSRDGHGLDPEPRLGSSERFER